MCVCFAEDRIKGVCVRVCVQQVHSNRTVISGSIIQPITGVPNDVSWHYERLNCLVANPFISLYPMHHESEYFSTQPHCCPHTCCDSKQRAKIFHVFHKDLIPAYAMFCVLGL